MTERLVKVNLYARLPAELVGALRAYAARLEITRAEAMRRLLCVALGRPAVTVRRRGRPKQGGNI